MQINVNEIRESGKKLFVATPMYGGQCFGTFTKSMMDLGRLGVHYQIPIREYFLFNESLIQRARNYCVDEFLRSDCTHLMFIDSDIGFNPNDVLSLLYFCEADDYSIITGPYPKKAIAWEKISKAAQQGIGVENPYELEPYMADFVFNPAPGVTSFRMDEPFRIREGGTGFMMVHRSVFEKMAEAFPETQYLPDHSRTEHFDGSRMINAFFDCVIDDERKRYLSEDYYFCRQAEKIGIDVWLCPWMKLAHTGMSIFSGDLYKMTQIGASVTSDQTSNKKVYKK